MGETTTEAPEARSGPQDVTRRVLAAETLSGPQVHALGEPLDRSRVLQREGAGKKTFDYLAGHDVIRTANRIFGFGWWGTTIIEQERIGSVQVFRDTRDGKQPGRLVGYRTVVRLTVAGCQPVDGSGYGDGQEYGDSAEIKASELALKESETDALKRAFVKFGDQFGLELYEKEKEAKARAEREERDNDPIVKAAQGGLRIPESSPEAAELLRGIGVETEWLTEATRAQYGKPGADLAGEEKRDLLRRLRLVWVAACELTAGGDFPPPDRTTIQAAFTRGFDRPLEGPQWSLSPDETDRPSRDEWMAKNSGRKPETKEGQDGT